MSVLMIDIIYFSIVYVIIGVMYARARKQDKPNAPIWKLVLAGMFWPLIGFWVIVMTMVEDINNAIQQFHAVKLDELPTKSGL